jgi:hypothetical protein
MQWVMDRIHPPVRYVRIDRWDTWSMDSTLAAIVLPMLRQLQDTKHGAPHVDDEDVPEVLRSTAAEPKENEWDTDSNHFLRWDWVLDEMIWAFEQKVADDAEGQFFDQIVPLGDSYSACYTGPNCVLLKGLSTLVIQEEFSNIRLFHTSAGICFAGKKGGFESLYSEKGKLLHQGNFESVLPATGKLIVASLNKKWGVAGSDGNWISDNRFDSVQLVFRSQDEARFPVVFYKKGKSLLVDEKGKELTEPCNCVWFEAGEGKLFRRNGNAIQMLDAQGKRAGDIEFEDFKMFSEGNVAVKTAGKWGFANHSGRMVIPAKFSEVLPFIGGIAYAKENGLWGVLRKNGSWLVKPSGISVFIDSDGKRKLVLP